jgi:toxin ParE1/3/4
MDHRIVWSERALQDLKGIVQYIARDDQGTAERFGNLIISKVWSLRTFPRVGRVVPEFREEHLREIILTPYRIVYEIDDGELVLSILRVWHGARGTLQLQGGD